MKLPQLTHVLEHAVSKSNAQASLVEVFLRLSELIRVEGVELISVATRKGWETFEGWWTLARVQGVFIRSIARMSLHDSALRRDSVVYGALFKIVLQKSDC